MATSPRIATLTLNPAVDHTANAPDFHSGRVNRVDSLHSDAGGKGVNVASFLAQYGHEVAATGLLGRNNQDPFDALFAEMGILDRFVKLPGSTRVNVKIVDQIRELVTDINFPGLEVGPEEVDAVSAAVRALAAEGVEWFILSGSLPKGVPTDVYRHLTEQLKAAGCKVMLDSSGIPFDRALQARPHVVKPNIDELREVIGSTPQSNAEIVAAARDLADGEIELVIVSMHDRGAIFVTADEAVLAVPPRARVVSTVGTGDAMLAGVVHGRLAGMTLPEIARLSTALSLGALGQIGPMLPPLEDIDAFADLVDVSTLAIA